jgi:hypothetical protein
LISEKDPDQGKIMKTDQKAAVLNTVSDKIMLTFALK